VITGSPVKHALEEKQREDEIKVQRMKVQMRKRG
jgi:hypothetical protein